MLTTELVTLVYNHIQHVIYLRIEFYPDFDRPGGYHPTDQVVSLSNIVEIFKVYCI